ncbi:hypothetical protein D3C84_630150 [compost metagenome]
MLVCEFGEEAQNLGHIGDVPGQHILMRAGRADRFQRRKGRRVRLDQVGPTTHGAGALARRTGRPVTLAKGLPGVLHRFVDQRHIGDRQRGVVLAIGGPYHLQPRQAVAVCPADKMGTAYLDAAGVEAVHKGLREGAGRQLAMSCQASILEKIAPYVLPTLAPI